jgi:hypothetical protein
MLALLTLIACAASDSGAEFKPDVDVLDVPPPCASGTWGTADATTAASAWHVSEGAGGTGTPDSPFGTLADAIEASRGEGAQKSIVVWPGSYTATLDLGGTDLGDTGLRVLGCGATEVRIEGESNVLPVVKLSTAAEIELAGVTLSGGRRGVLAWQGSQLTLTNVVVDGAGRAGVVIDGSSTYLRANTLQILDPVTESAAPAYGLAVQGAQIEVDGLDIVGASTAGVVIDGSSTYVRMDRVTVSDTRVASDGRFGRGIHLQGQASLELSNATLLRNHDAGLFALQGMSVRLTGVDVADTLAADIASGVTSADGITITDGAPSENWGDTYFTAELSGVNVSAAGRAGVLLTGNGLGVTLGEVAITGAAFDPGSGLAIAQDGAQISGADVHRLDTGDLLQFNAQTMAADDPTN